MRRALRTVLLVVSLLSVAGCALPKHWVKGGATIDDFNRDSYECAREARQIPPLTQVRVGDSLDFYRACLVARGYQRVKGGEWVGLRD